jgi:2-polyprenyl-3-methyl-5-hydroxy-6-metoxy-1,4-benzoquinol methylase
MSSTTTPIDEARLEAFMGRLVTDMGAAMTAPLVLLGDQLGLYQAMAGAGAMTSTEVAEAASVRERYVREWLANQVASGYVEHDAVSDRYTLPPEHALALADPDSPFNVLGGYQIMASIWADEERILDRFRRGEGMGWHEHDPRLFAGTERFFRPGYQAHLVPEWIPALDGLQDALRAGITVADIGCGLGASTILMAQAFPRSTFVGFDYHAGSIETARERAAQAGVGDRVTFEVASADAYPGGPYDLICHFDCLHDMGDPVGAARHVRETITPDGWWLIVEPFAGDSLEENENPVGRLFYAASTVLCTPNSLSQEVGLGLGAQAGERRLAEVIHSGGMTRFRRATETPFNLVLEARP